MKILLLSSYNTHSHNYWSNLLINHLDQYDWTFLSLPPRKFQWRIRGNPLSWYAKNKEELSHDYDTILATSMVDLATIIGLFPNLAKSNKVVYFHENQFEYPCSEKVDKPNVEAMMVNLYAAFCADKVLFNSEYNRDSFFAGAEDILKRINDHSPVSALDYIKIKTNTLAVPVRERKQTTDSKIPNSIVWNHRWEYDKNPEDFYQALKILKNKNIDFKLIVMGIQFKNSPKVFNLIKNDFMDNIVAWGYQSKNDYNDWLKKGQFVVSTAIHEFQGLAIMEAVQMGAVPIVPDRLSYPQWFSQEYLYGNSPKELADHIMKNFKKIPQIPDLSSVTWGNLKNQYIEYLKSSTDT